MFRLSRIIFGLTICVVCAASARADEASKSTKVDELLAMTLKEETVGTIVSSLSMTQAQLAAMKYMRTGSILPKEKIEELRKEIEANFRAVLPAWRKTVHDSYAELFTEEELETIVAFHKSSAGEKFMTRGLELGANTMRNLNDLTRKPVEDTVARFLEENKPK